MTTVSTDHRRGINSGAAIKVTCVCATTANITLSGEQTIDGILTSGTRVFVKDQTDATEIGIYKSSASAWTREPDFDGTWDVTEGTLIPVSRGTVSGNTVWRITNIGTITVGTTSLTLTQGLTDASGTAFTQDGTGAVISTVDAKLNEFVSVLDFGADPTGAADSAVAIQAAIDSVATGAYVTFPEGDYKITAKITIPSNTTLYSSQRAVIKPTTALVDSAFFENSDTSGGNVNIVIDGLHIDATAITTATVDSAAMNFKIVVDLDIRNCIFENLPVSAVTYADVDNFNISNNRITTTGTASLTVAAPVETGGGLIASDVTDGVISGNVITDCWAVCIYIDASAGGGKTRNIAINNNRIGGSADNGIRVNGIRPDALTDLSRISIVGNTIVDIDGSGIRATGSYITVTGNNISLQALTVSDVDATHAPSGIDIEGIYIVVDSNVIYDGTGIMIGGIRMTFNASTIHNVTISNNIIDNIGAAAGSGIVGTLGTGTTFRDITITGNRVNGTQVQEGVFLDNIDGLIFTNNSITNSFQEGLWMDTCSNAIITGNLFKNNNTQDSGGTRGGIRIQQCTSVKIANNRAFDDQGSPTQRYGLYVDGTGGTACDYIQVIDNDFRGNATDAYAQNAPTNMVVERNLGYVTENSGVTSVADGGSLTHGLETTPTYILLTTSTSQEMVAATSIGPTTVTLAIKKHDGTAGTTQNIHWLAVYKP